MNTGVDVADTVSPPSSGKVFCGCKMAACLSPWPAAEPAIVDTTTLEGWEMARAKQLHLLVFSQQESSWLTQPLNFKFSFLTQNSFSLNPTR